LQAEAIEKGWYSRVNPNYQLLNVEAINPDIENAYALRQFSKPKADDLRVMYSKNMLNEGIHDDEISGEIMLRPTKSYILFMQQVGRILSRNRTTSPVVLDLVGNIRYFEQFRQEIITTIQEHKGDRRYLQSTREFEDFRIIEETNDFIKSFEQIEANLDEYLSKTSISELLDILEILQSEGIDINKIPQSKRENGKQISTTLLDINQGIIQKYGLDKDYKIGWKIRHMLQAYKGYGRYVITDEDRIKIEKLGFDAEKETSVAELLRILEILHLEGIDVKKVPKSKTTNGKQFSATLLDINQDGIDIHKIIQKHGLDKDYKIGRKINYMLQAYKGCGTCVITKEDRIKIERLGFNEEKGSSVEELLRILEILQSEGVDVKKIPQTKNVNGKKISTTLLDIEQDGIDIKEIIHQYGLDKYYNIGMKITSMSQAYKGNSAYAITETDKKKIEQFGFGKEKESSIVEALRILEILQSEGVDVKKIPQRKRANGKQISTTLSDINQEGVNIQEIIERYGLDKDYKIGQKIMIMLQAYEGRVTYAITEEDKRRAEALGIIKIKDMEAEQKRLAQQVQEAEVLKQKVIAHKGKEK